MAPTAVVAVGGNALIRDPEHQTVPDQYRAAADTSRHIAAIAREGWNVVVTHGNGPQVGFILRRSELSAHELHEVPLDACVADTQGAIGYALQQNLQHDLRTMGVDRQVVTVLTQVEVDPADPAFARPTKPIGSHMTEEYARRREADGWTVVEDAGRGWRRVVPSPLPRRIVEEDVIRHLVEAGFLVIAVGGGGIPVVPDAEGRLHGVAAVIDKDHAASLLARRIDADRFLISTSVKGVALGFGTPEPRWLDRLTVSEARHHLEGGSEFPEGSMGPKVRAAISFAEATGQPAVIAGLDSMERALAGEAGTWIVPDGHDAAARTVED
jgi:carbamate kinase